ncbi:MAG: hypothetical protein JNK96_03780 [Betaproteobacteria bacterium]|jgi:uncharacterized protein with PIN domain|nr:hypothetical protein [Betaproteobacteria bacterium]
MLGRLARYLRAAGYDTRLAVAGQPDRDLLRLAQAEDRHFLTCDRLILQHRAAAGVAHLLVHGDLEALAASVAESFGLNWLHDPFSRCLVDNTPLEATLHAVHPELPADLAGRAISRCPVCGRVYWFGAHCRRMRQRLAAWQAAQAIRSAGPPPDRDERPDGPA